MGVGDGTHVNSPILLTPVIQAFLFNRSEPERAAVDVPVNLWDDEAALGMHVSQNDARVSKAVKGWRWRSAPTLQLEQSVLARFRDRLANFEATVDSTLMPTPPPYITCDWCSTSGDRIIPYARRCRPVIADKYRCTCGYDGPRSVGIGQGLVDGMWAEACREQ
jgi:hypothetical protein